MLVIKDAFSLIVSGKGAARREVPWGSGQAARTAGRPSNQHIGPFACLRQNLVLSSHSPLIATLASSRGAWPSHPLPPAWCQTRLTQVPNTRRLGGSWSLGRTHASSRSGCPTSQDAQHAPAYVDSDRSYSSADTASLVYREVLCHTSNTHSSPRRGCGCRTGHSPLTSPGLHWTSPPLEPSANNRAADPGGWKDHGSYVVA